MDRDNSIRSHEIFYRAGLVMQTLGLALLAVLYPVESPFYTAGIMLFELGVCLSAVCLAARMRAVKMLVVSSVILGLISQAYGYFLSTEQYAGTVILAGIGLVCAGAAGMAGKEAFCSGFPEGWLLALLGFPMMVLANLLARENIIFNAAGFSVLFLLLLSLTGKKLRQPVLWKCGTKGAGTPH